MLVWQFDEVPGGASVSKFVDDFYVSGLACGDYDCRRPVMDLGFSMTAGAARFPATAGTHTVTVGASDYAGNATTRDFTYTVE